MGMPGLWISKPRGFADLDHFFNEADDLRLQDIEADVRAGSLYLKLKRDYRIEPLPSDFEPDPNERQERVLKLQKHIRRHWYDEDDKGWWPLDPVEEIRTEAVYQCAARVRNALASGVGKSVVSYWLCPGAHHFEIAICESAEEIAVLVVSPPEPASGHWADYQKYVESLFKKPGDKAMRTDTLQFKVKATRGTIQNKFKLYQPGRRVRIKQSKDVTFFRAIVSREISGNDLIVNIKAGVGAQAHKLASRFECWAVDLSGRQYPSDPHYTVEQDIWVVTQTDRASDTDSVPVDSVVLGTAVRRLKNSYSYST